MTSGPIFLTGASGMVGREILAWLLAHTDREIWVLEHVAPVWVHSRRVRVLKGDILVENLALTDAELKNIREHVTDVIHAAGSTNFGATLEEARHANVTGMQHVFALCEAAREARFGFISTVFVAGRRMGCVLEKELYHDAGFVNTYEQSKYEAELWLQHVSQHVPVSIYRLSTLLGDSRNGVTSEFTAPHQLMRLVRLGLVSILPGEEATPVDLMPTDYAIDTFCTLHFVHRVRGTYHIAAGREASLTLAELVALTYDCFSALDSSWAKLRIPKPVLVNRAVFSLYTQSIEESGNPLFLHIVMNTKFFAEQLLYPKDFDVGGVTAYIPQYRSTMPSISDTYKKVLLFCVRNNWRTT